MNGASISATKQYVTGGTASCPLFAAEIRKCRTPKRDYSLWRWHVDEVFVRINGELHYLWLALDQEGEVLEAFVTKTRDKKPLSVF